MRFFIGMMVFFSAITIMNAIPQEEKNNQLRGLVKSLAPTLPTATKNP